MALSDNHNPELSWDEVPEGVRSFVLLCVDPDVPTIAEQVNREDLKIDADLPRCDFYHWVMINIPADCRQIAQGSCSSEVTIGGKRNPTGPNGSRQGVNDYTDFMAGSEMAGQYHGYDGPCPPWNDERMHHYYFRVYALNVAELDLAEHFNGGDVTGAMKAHVLASAEIMGRYTLNADLL